MTAGEATPPSAVDSDLAHEAALVARAATDAAAFSALYNRYVVAVYRYAYRRLGSHEDAEDVTAQTFHRALERIGGYEWRGAPFGAWLFRIAHNLVVDRRRAGSAPLSLDGLSANGYHPLGTNPSVDDDLVARESLDAAWAAVALLPALQRRAVTLRFGRDLSHAEVGALIGRSEPATKQLIYRAMKTLRARLAAREGDEA
ncbi:MAG: sigma-70 family RNA polymerase sigma factor [Dehalococcoidia bacterium]